MELLFSALRIHSIAIVEFRFISHTSQLMENSASREINGINWRIHEHRFKVEGWDLMFEAG